MGDNYGFKLADEELEARAALLDVKLWLSPHVMDETVDWFIYKEGSPGPLQMDLSTGKLIKGKTPLEAFNNYVKYLSEQK